MAKPRKVVLREAELDDIHDAHVLLKRKLDFPFYYGENLDALADCLEDISVPTRIILRRDAKETKPWFDSLVRVVADCALESCYLACIVRTDIPQVSADASKG